MADGMAIQKDGQVLQVEELFDFVIYPEWGDASTPIFAGSDDYRVRPLGRNRFEVISPDGTQTLDLHFEG
jgi:hypothetical protein